jgi:TolB protein
MHPKQIFQAIFACGTLAIVPVTAHAQNPTPPEGVRLGLNYALGTKPGVLVLPMTDSAGGDSIRAILQRDIDYDDRATVIALPDSAAQAMIPATGDDFNYPLFAKLGVAAILRPERSLTGINITMYDVAAKKRAQVGGFPLLDDVYSPAWRMSVHRASDEVERWIFGTRGAAATRVLYAGGDKQIWVIDSDGANARKLTSVSLAMSPGWNPNGTKFVFCGFTASGSQVAVYNFITGDLHWLAGTARGLNITPAYAPDGRTIAYASGGDGGTNILVMQEAAGTPSRRITVGRGSDNTSPAYSPDGRQIAFMSGRAGHPEVYTMDADGTNPTLLTEFTYGEQNYRASPDWAPDGRRIAYESRIDGQFQIMTIDMRDHSTKQYTSDGQNEDPSWAPDSRHIVFSSTRTGPRQLWVLDAESGRMRQLTHDSGSRLAAWSPILNP